MPALTVRMLRDYLNSLTEESDLNSPCLMPVQTDMPHIFAFEEVCPTVTEMIDIGPAPDYMPDSRQGEGNLSIKALLIAPHSFHQHIETEGDEEKLKTLN